MFESYGYIGLFIASFLASTILPLGSEGIIVYLIKDKFDFFTVVIVASIGNFLGSCTTYYIGLKGRDYIDSHENIKKYFGIKPEDIERSQVYFSKYGNYVLLFTWVPFIGDMLTITSGILKFNFLMFTIFVFTGKFLRYFAVAYLTIQVI